MSDTAAVALITAGSGVLIASIGSLTTYVVSRHQSRAEQRRTLEENERLRKQILTEERRDRYRAYKQCLLVLNRFEEMEWARNLENEQIEEAWERYRSMRSALQLHAPAPVTKALLGNDHGGGGVNKVLADVRRSSWGAGPKDRPRRWQSEFQGRRIPFKDAQGNLIRAMRKDVTEGVFMDAKLEIDRAEPDQS